MSSDPGHIMWGKINAQVSPDLGWAAGEQYILEEAAPPLC